MNEKLLKEVGRLIVYFIFLGICILPYFFNPLFLASLNGEIAKQGNINAKMFIAVYFLIFLLSLISVITSIFEVYKLSKYKEKALKEKQQKNNFLKSFLRIFKLTKIKVMLTLTLFLFSSSFALPICATGWCTEPSLYRKLLANIFLPFNGFYVVLSNYRSSTLIYILKWSLIQLIYFYLLACLVAFSFYLLSIVFMAALRKVKR